MCKSFLLDKDTWYQVTVYKPLKNSNKNIYTNVQWIQFPMMYTEGEITLLFIKIYISLLYCHERVEMVAWQTDRQNDWDRETKDSIIDNTSLALAGPSGIRAGWGIEINGRFEAERPPPSAGPPSGGRAATLTPLSPMYSTRPCCLV